MPTSLRLRWPVQLIVDVIPPGRTRLLALGLRIRVIRVPTNLNCRTDLLLRGRLRGSVDLLSVEVCVWILGRWCEGHCALAWGAGPGLACVEGLWVSRDRPGALDGWLRWEGVCVC
jgi:hypothetical protein